MIERRHIISFVVATLSVFTMGIAAQAKEPLEDSINRVHKKRSNWRLDSILRDDFEDNYREDEVAGWQAFLESTGSQSIGSASGGRLADAREIPKDNSVYIRKNRDGIFGTDETVAILQWLAHSMQIRYPGTVPMVIGDLSRKGGGSFKPHLSHQSGRDVDIGYYLAGNTKAKRFKHATRQNFDLEKNWAMVELLLKTGRVQYLFIDRKLHKLLFEKALEMGWNEEETRKLFEAPIGRRPKSGIIRHVKGHINHIHVRFHCPSNDKSCVN